MRSKLTPLLLSFLFVLNGLISGQTSEVITPAKAVDVPTFKLPASAVAAGINGKLAISLSINPDGTTRNVRVYGNPMWPCGSKMPGSEIDDVKESVKEHVLAIKFSPEMKDGKPRSAEAQITLMLSPRFVGAARIPGRLFLPKDGEPLVDVGQIESFVEDLKRPSSLVESRGSVVLQILVDQTGKVTHAGAFKGLPALEKVARDAICSSKFRPATVDGQPHSMTGTLTYFFR